MLAKHDGRFHLIEDVYRPSCHSAGLLSRIEYDRNVMSKLTRYTREQFTVSGQLYESVGVCMRVKSFFLSSQLKRIRLD
ncbi:hypothetical protein X737_32180 [Mesorhizobium sp. L48C026A00]|nr:hypothetical protein X737_32180 [Mesorhizobium sp. L48C026A00]